MQGFPFDSQLSFDENSNPIYDRAVSSQPLRKLIRDLFTTGVMPNPSTNFQVSAGTDGMTVQVQAGFAVVDGGLCQENEVRTLEVTASDKTYDRIDTVVLRWNENVDVRRADLYVVAGTPSATPVRPTLQRDNSIYEIGLADVFVTKRVATVTNDKITDTRYASDRCGVVSSVSEWDTTTIYQQVQADLAGFKATEQAAFMTWFETIKNTLDGNVAAHLQNEINSVNQNVAEISQNLQAKDGNGNTLDFQFSTNGTDYGYLDRNGNFIPFRTRHTESYKPTSRANNLDMGLYHKKRYVDTTAVPNANSSTYTFPANDLGGTKDLGSTNTYRYVNAENVRAKGIADADARANPNSVNYQTGYNAGRAVIDTYSSVATQSYSLGRESNVPISYSVPTTGYYFVEAIVSATTNTVQGSVGISFNNALVIFKREDSCAPTTGSGQASMHKIFAFAYCYAGSTISITNNPSSGNYNIGYSTIYRVS